MLTWMIWTGTDPKTSPFRLCRACRAPSQQPYNFYPCNYSGTRAFSLPSPNVFSCPSSWAQSSPTRCPPGPATATAIGATPPSLPEFPIPVPIFLPLPSPSPLSDARLGPAGARALCSCAPFARVRRSRIHALRGVRACARARMQLMRNERQQVTANVGHRGARLRRCHQAGPRRSRSRSRAAPRRHPVAKRRG